MSAKIFWALAATASLTLGCGKAPPPGGGDAPKASSSTEALPPIKPAGLTRKTTPKERLAADEKACDAKDAKACRRVTDRYRGYGHVAGCGVERAGAKPRRKLTADDAKSDRKSYDTWIRKLCDLGDEEACLQGANNVVSSNVSERTADACARSSVADCPLYLWVQGTRPDALKTIDKDRKGFMTNGYHGKLFVELYRRSKTRGGDALPKELLDLGVSICKTSLECDDVLMMLDKDGYTPAALAPLRKAAGDVLATSCLEGDCTCGEAARYVDPSDPRALDLAKLGCEDGDAEACFALGDFFERGAGVEKSWAQAFHFYELACPQIVGDESTGDDFSKAACDRLSQRYEEGVVLEKDRDRAFFYSSLACPRSGFARDQSFCIHRAIFHGVNQYRGDFLLTTTQVAREYLNGPDGDPINGKECSRPSVEAECKRAAALIR